MANPLVERFDVWLDGHWSAHPLRTALLAYLAMQALFLALITLVWLAVRMS